MILQLRLSRGAQPSTCTECDTAFPSKRQLRFHNCKPRETATPIVEDDVGATSAPIVGDKLTTPVDDNGIESEDVAEVGFMKYSHVIALGDY